MSLIDLSCIPIEDIEKARENLAGRAYRTPLIPLNYDVDNKKIYLKLENLQPVGSFKLRGACNALRNIPLSKLRHGVYTSSAGNFAQGLAWTARELGIPCTVIVPDTAPHTKLDAIKRYGADTLKVSFDSWWNVMLTHRYPGMTGRFVHPVADRDVIAGNGTIGLEILEDLDHIDAVICPFGGGGMATGVASALRSRSPHTKVYACEVDVAAPLMTSLKANAPSVVANHKSTFVDGMGGKSLFPEMWNLVKHLITDSIPLSVGDISKAVKLILTNNRVLAEGAGAATVAAALSGKAGNGTIVCVVSGGNIDVAKLIQILEGNVPS